MKIDILYDDSDIVVINKAANVLTIPDRYDQTLPNLKTYLSKKYGDIYVVHRLDKETSGVLLFAKNEIAHKHINDQFQIGRIDKRYQAICLNPVEKSGLIEEHIVQSKRNPGKYEVAKKGKLSTSEYQVIEVFKQYALISIKIFTGRTHQIRVHMKHIGAPLLVDSKYGVSDKFLLSQIKRYKRKPEQEERPLLSRSSLHASELTIVHPTSKEEVTFYAPLHKDMKAVLSQFRKNFS